MKLGNQIFKDWGQVDLPVLLLDGEMFRRRNVELYARFDVEQLSYAPVLLDEQGIEHQLSSINVCFTRKRKAAVFCGETKKKQMAHCFYCWNDVHSTLPARKMNRLVVEGVHCQCGILHIFSSRSGHTQTSHRGTLESLYKTVRRPDGQQVMTTFFLGAPESLIDEIGEALGVNHG